MPSSSARHTAERPSPAKPPSAAQGLLPFAESTRQWFLANFDAPTSVQTRGWEHIAGGEHALLLAPTGSGKTLAAFLWAIDRQLRTDSDAPEGVRVLYISPLKALVYDIERNLRAPLVGTLKAAEQLGQTVRRVGVDIRTGDTPARDRRRQAKHPADILVTTPESLFLLLTSQAAATLAHVHTVIIDEIHALAPTKRGAHLALSLERLCLFTKAEPQRIGLSATVRPHHEAARYLCGQRRVAIVDESAKANIDLNIVVPVPDMDKPPPGPRAPEKGGSVLAQIMATERPKKERDPGLWASIYPALFDVILKNRSTIVFVNSRSLCERLAQRLNELAEGDLVRAHHGSMALSRRTEIEEALKSGALRGIVATSSLELGIDMGAVDMVVLVQSPGSVARGLQRVGRAGHSVGEKSRGIVFPKFKGDLLECAVISERMRQGELEPVKVPHNALDVLAQHLVGMCSQAPQPVDALLSTVRRAYPYASLTRAMLESVLDMLSGTYPSDAFADLRPYLSWDRSTDVVSARRGAALVAVLNAGTIPDRGLFAVHLGEGGPRLGELDEEMVHESRKGDTFLLGASTWRVESITRDRVIVSPAPGEPGKMPFWRGDGPGRPIELGRAMGAFLRRMGQLKKEDAQAHLTDTMGLDAFAAENLTEYIARQRAETGALPTDRAITVERFRDEMGDWRVCILSPFGARVHAPWALALEHSLGAQAGFAVQTMYSDDGIVLRFADSEQAPAIDRLFPDAADVEEQVMGQLQHSALFASVFRENAGRALLLPRRRGDGRTPLWQQRLKSKMLLAAAQRFPSFPIVLETYRHCLRDIFDVPALVDLLRAVNRREIIVDEVETASASPFARSLAFAYVAAYLYEQDMPLAERKAQALTLDRELLRELLGGADLRELLDASVLDQVAEALQQRVQDRLARNADEVHDLLRRLGDLTAQEIAERTADAERAASFLEDLQKQRRVARLRIAGEERFVAVEDVARYRDALGAVPPSGLPERFLSTVSDPFTSIVRRYARTHGPFLSGDLVQRYAVTLKTVEQVLFTLEGDGSLFRGAIRPSGTEPEWCDVEVLRRLKRATLAKLRHEVAAVDRGALARFLPLWHNLDNPRRGARGLEDAIARLEGLAVPWSALVGTLLPTRVPDFHPDMLDRLCAMGVIVWVGQGALGNNDGRVKLYRRAQAAVLIEPVTVDDANLPSPLHQAIMAHLNRRGACFTVELSQVAGSPSLKALEEALWDLVWLGLVTNDTVGPLRSLGVKKRRQARVSKHSLVGGRWSKVADLVDPEVTPTERIHARAVTLLERYGVVSREVSAAEEIPGGFSALYAVLKAMEEAGKVRRGYFVEGLSGAQFAYASAVERLRQGRGEAGHSDDAPFDEAAVRIVAACDPVNPYGTLFAWPARPEEAAALRPRRVPMAYVVTFLGTALCYVDPSGHALITFKAMWTLDDGVSAAAFGLRKVAARRHGQALNVRRIDQEAALTSPRMADLQRAGLIPSFDGLTVLA